MNYEPKTEDLSSIKLSEELENLTEKISEKIHDAWAEKRIQNGWTYGSVYDDVNKVHPCLVEYSRLTDEEKEIDKVTVISTIKMLLKFGYKIERGEK